jgi:DNA-binding MarR family transcriptional regulator
VIFAGGLALADDMEGTPSRVGLTLRLTSGVVGVKYLDVKILDVETNAMAAAKAVGRGARTATDRAPTRPVRARARGATRDSIDVFVSDWRRERPDLDPWPLHILGRVTRVAALLERRATTWLRPLGLTWETFSVIVALRRSGPPCAQKPSDLLRLSLLTSGAMTNRIDRVEALGLVVRRPDPDDRRGVIVQLTPAGRALADKAIRHHFAAAADALGFLGRGERTTLESSLAHLLAGLEVEGEAPRAGAGAARAAAARRVARTAKSPAPARRIARAL